MFKKIRYHLLLSYLGIFASLLGTFAIAVRVFVTHSLNQQLIDKLTALGQLAAADIELENGYLEISSDFSDKDLIDHQQALEWFDVQGKFIAKQGRDVLNLPLSVSNTVQFQTVKTRIIGVSLPG